MYSKKTRSKNAKKCKNKSLKMKGGSSKKMRLFAKKLKAISSTLKNKKKFRKTRSKQKGGRVGMPIEYYGGKSNVWTNSSTATTGKNIQSGYTWNDFSNVKPKC
tara:strand:- start:226 stop:537 length:312 start_codon:yes stop_codon:yes gene_type:complete